MKKPIPIRNGKTGDYARTGTASELLARTDDAKNAGYLPAIRQKANKKQQKLSILPNATTLRIRNPIRNGKTANCARTETASA